VSLTVCACDVGHLSGRESTDVSWALSFGKDLAGIMISIIILES
jgi:hypothetical protein